MRFKCFLSSCCRRMIGLKTLLKLQFCLSCKATLSCEDMSVVGSRPFNKGVNNQKYLRQRTEQCSGSLHWRMGGGTRGANPLLIPFFSFSCSFGKKFWQIMGRHTPSGVGARLLENPGSATVPRRSQ